MSPRACGRRKRSALDLADLAPARSAAPGRRYHRAGRRVADDLFAYQTGAGLHESLAAALHRSMAARPAMPAMPRTLRRRPRRSMPGRKRRRSRIWSRSRCLNATACCRCRGRRRRGVAVSGNAYDVLARIRAARSAPQPVGERCEMCSEAIADEHQHVVNVEGRQLMCVCRGCYLLFTDTKAQLRYRAIPDRYLSFPDFALGRREWELLQIPVGLVLLPQLGAGPHRRVLPGSGGRDGI